MERRQELEARGIPSMAPERKGEFLRQSMDAVVVNAAGGSLNREAVSAIIADAHMRKLNRDYRRVDRATDVLSFTMTADSPQKAMWSALPVVNLGSVFVSLEWAHAHAGTEGFERYALERVVHGWLHLMGQNHDTQADYEKVVAIQTRVLRHALGAA